MRVLVIGGGPAGLAAAYAAAESGHEVLLAEKNEKLGKKLYITGKGRCNLTNDCSAEDFLGHVVSNPKFLYRAAYAFPPESTMDFFETRRVPLVTERGGRVFPASGKASDVTACLERACKSVGAEIRLNTEIAAIRTENGAVVGAETKSGETLEADAVVVCTGGLSYPATGSTGDGYRFASALGIAVVPPRASLVGIEIAGGIGARLQGLSLKNVRLTASDGKKAVFSELGEMLFTHYGVSGPLVLSASALLNRLRLTEVSLAIDLKPGLTDEMLDRRILRDFDAAKNKRAAAALVDLLPRRMIAEILSAADIPESKAIHSITQAERKRLRAALKAFPLSPTALRPIEEGIVTAGGVDCREVDPSTMRAKRVKGLSFAGEVLDLDAVTGGYNIQIALSTGMAAGRNLESGGTTK